MIEYTEQTEQRLRGFQSVGIQNVMESLRALQSMNTSNVNIKKSHLISLKKATGGGTF